MVIHKIEIYCNIINIIIIMLLHNNYYVINITIYFYYVYYHNILPYIFIKNINLQYRTVLY